MTALVHRFLEFSKRAPAPPEGDSSPASRVRPFVASSETVDSYNTIIKASAWDRDLEHFERNPVIFFGHRSRELPIGKGKAGVESKRLMVDVDFFPLELNPLADQALRILDAGVMGLSVGFEPIEWEYNESRETGDEWQDYFYPPLDFTRVKLLEASVVPLPANPDSFPVGRSAGMQERVQARFLERIGRRSPARAAAAPVCATCSQEMVCANAECADCMATAKAGAVPLTRAEFIATIERVVREYRVQKQSAALRLRGKTSRS